MGRLEGLNSGNRKQIRCCDWDIERAVIEDRVVNACMEMKHYRLSNMDLLVRKVMVMMISQN